MIAWTRRAILAAALVLTAAPVAAETRLGDDGLHKAPWMRETFKDLREDLAEANAEGKRFAIIFEQRGCIYCTKMHEEVFPREEVADYLNENYFVVQLNLHGDLEVVDFDGDIRSEKAMARKWGILFTPTLMFLPEEVAEGATAPEAAVATMPGAFGWQTTLDLLTWVNEKRYELDTEEDFQRYHARRIEERANAATE
jgi:thioredoxin-related protein